MNILKAIIKNPFYVKPKSWSPEDTTGQGSPYIPSISTFSSWTERSLVTKAWSGHLGNPG